LLESCCWIGAKCQQKDRRECEQEFALVGEVVNEVEHEELPAWLKMKQPGQEVRAIEEDVLLTKGRATNL
jgi:hypothetical protein